MKIRSIVSILLLTVMVHIPAKKDTHSGFIRTVK